MNALLRQQIIDGYLSQEKEDKKLDSAIARGDWKTTRAIGESVIQRSGNASAALMKAIDAIESDPEAKEQWMEIWCDEEAQKHLSEACYHVSKLGGEGIQRLYAKMEAINRKFGDN